MRSCGERLLERPELEKYNKKSTMTIIFQHCGLDLDTSLKRYAFSYSEASNRHFCGGSTARRFNCYLSLLGSELN